MRLKIFIVVVAIVAFLVGWWQGFNAGAEYMAEEFWDDYTEQTELKI